MDKDAIRSVVHIIFPIPRKLSISKPLLPDEVDDEQLYLLKHNKHLRGLKILIELCSVECALVLNPCIKELEENIKQALNNTLKEKGKKKYIVEQMNQGQRSKKQYPLLNCEFNNCFKM